MKGMTSGYLKGSPLAALILAIIMQTILRVASAISIGIPTRIKQSGKASTI